MKKLLALVLALVMLAAAGQAYAAGNGCSPEMYRTWYTQLENAYDYDIIWNSSPSRQGSYTVYSGRSSDGMMNVSIYALNDLVAYVESTGTLSVSMNDTDTASKFGEWFGVSLSNMVMAFYIAETGSLDNSAIDQFIEDLGAISGELSDDASDDEKVKEGIVASGNVLGYPVRIELQGSENGNNRATFTMEIRVSSNAASQDLSSTPGNVTGDAKGLVNGEDLLALARYLAGENVTINRQAADVNGDGAVDGRDVIRLARYLSGQNVKLGK